MGAELARQYAVEQVRAMPFEPARRGGSTVAGRPKTVDIAISFVNVFWPSWQAAILTIGVEHFAYDDHGFSTLLRTRLTGGSSVKHGRSA
jgi:hypothetical protein